MKGFAKLKVVKRAHGVGYEVCNDELVFGSTVAVVANVSLTDGKSREIAERIAAALNDETYISEDDLKELEVLAKRVQDRSEYGGGLILSLVNMYRNVKAHPAVNQ